jgi:hypothetical protein
LAGIVGCPFDSIDRINILTVGVYNNFFVIAGAFTS